jgi:hypothetical protein
VAGFNWCKDATSDIGPGGVKKRGEFYPSGGLTAELPLG